MAGLMTSGGDRSGSMMPVSPTAIGVGLVALSVLGLFGYQFLAGVSGLVVRPGGIYFFLGNIGLGLALIGWDRLTDRFDEAGGSPNQF